MKKVSLLLVPVSKLTLGMPFYGYDVGTDPVEGITYRSMVNINEDNAYQHQSGMAL